jgi:hypothetical protein
MLQASASMNGIEAMQAVTERPRELIIRSQLDNVRQILVTPFRDMR